MTEHLKVGVYIYSTAAIFMSSVHYNWNTVSGFRGSSAFSVIYGVCFELILILHHVL
jgi:hypothetical protein